MIGFLWGLFGALKEYAQIVELGIIAVTVGLGLFAARKLRENTLVMQAALEGAGKSMLSLQAALERASGQLRVVALGLTREMASDLEAHLEAAGKAAIERMRMAANEGKGEAPAIDAADAEPERQAHKRWWQPVVDMKFSGQDQPRRHLRWKNNVRVDLPWPGTWLTAWCNDSPDGVCGVGLSGNEEAIADFWRAIRRQRAELESELPEGATVDAGRFGIGITRPNAEFKDDDERRAWIISNLDRFASVLGPRMKALAEKRGS